jgi:hypothetical protein
MGQIIAFIVGVLVGVYLIGRPSTRTDSQAPPSSAEPRQPENLSAVDPDGKVNRKHHDTDHNSATSGVSTFALYHSLVADSVRNINPGTTFSQLTQL